MGTLLTRKCFLAVILALVGAFLSLPAFVSAQYYTNSDRPGYWWGKDAAQEEEEPPVSKQPAPKPEKQQPKEEAKKEEPHKYEWEAREELRFSEFTPQQIWDMKPKEFSALMDAFKDQSVWRPTEAHVHDTYAMIDMARRKAAAYTNVQQLVLSKDQQISTERDYPTSAPGKEVTRVARNEEVGAGLNAVAAQYGLFYFYKPGCPYCEAEEKILTFFVNSRHFSVQPINVQQNPEMAAQFNITITPSLVLVKRGNDTPIPISYGVIALDELEARVFNGVRAYEGQVTPEQYGVRDYERGGAFDPTAPLHR